LARRKVFLLPLTRSEDLILPDEALLCSALIQRAPRSAGTGILQMHRIAPRQRD
jgi:hypothetical protein